MFNTCVIVLDLYRMAVAHACVWLIILSMYSVIIRGCFCGCVNIHLTCDNKSFKFHFSFPKSYIYKLCFHMTFLFNFFGVFTKQKRCNDIQILLNKPKSFLIIIQKRCLTLTIFKLRFKENDTHPASKLILEKIIITFITLKNNCNYCTFYNSVKYKYFIGFE